MTPRLNLCLCPKSKPANALNIAPQLHVLRPSYAPPAGSEVGNSSWCWLTGWPCWFNHPRKLLPVCQQLWRILFANCRWCRWWAHQRRFGGLHLITLKQFHIYSQLTHTMTVLLILTLLTSQAYQSASSLGNLINFHFHLHLHETRPHVCHFFSTEIFSTQIFLHTNLEQKRHKFR